MVRALGYFILLAAVMAAVAWFADRPGEVTIVWQGWRIDASVGMVVLAVGIVAAVAAALHHLWWRIRRLPRGWARRRHDLRRRRGYLALTQGMVAVAAGDPDEAQRQARRADVLLSEPPLTMLLSAQAAQLMGDDNAANRYFTAMLERPETAFLGLRGLLMGAMRRGDRKAALDLARRARLLRPRTPWVLTTLFELETTAGELAAAELTLGDAIDNGAFAAAAGRRKRAVLLAEKSRVDDAAGRAAEALAAAKQAVAADPTLVPASARWSRLLAASGRARKAAKVAEAAYALSPHPDLVQAFLGARGETDPVLRYQRVEGLSRSAPDHPESRFALAEAALAARLWGEARRHLPTLNGHLEARHCRLMAQVEEGEHANREAASLWLARAAGGGADGAAPDPTWVCGNCGAVAASWTALCGHCGNFDTLAWREPGWIAPKVGAAPPPLLAAATAIAATPGSEPAA